MSRQLENARNLYIQGIEQGEVAEVLEKYMGDTYTQHSTGVGDGKQGFAAFFADFFQRHPRREIRIVRAIEDGPYVFLHVHQNLDGGQAQWITSDIFRADEQGRMVEHWDVIDAYMGREEGRDALFGDFALEDLDRTWENKCTIRSFLTEVGQNRRYDLISRFVAEDLEQRNLSIAQGLEAYKTYFVERRVEYDFVHQLLGQGNYVVAYSQVRMDGEKYAQMDIFHLSRGRIVEHWDNKEIIPPREQWTNSGKF